MNTIHVLAVDAADYELAKDFGCENLLLDSHRELETKTPPGGTMNLPKTGHIWPLIAIAGIFSTVPGVAVLASEGGVDTGDWFLVLATSVIVFGTLMAAYWTVTATFGGSGGSTDDA